MLHTPPFLKSGDTVGIIAPARKITFNEIDTSIKIFNSWGLQVVLGKNIFFEYNQFSGTDEQRAGDFQLMLNDNRVKAIFCARGGYGSVKIIDRLDFSAFINKPKWVVGYSDATVFHSHIHNISGIETLHATMPINLFNNDYSAETLNTLQDVLFGKPLKYEVSAHPFNKTGEAKGLLVGGNLSVLYSLIGSPSDIDTKGKILFIEDLDEYLYHIDRIMMCLKRADKLKNLSGLIIGGMNKMNDNTVPYGKTAYEIIQEAIKEHTFPVCFDFPAGHIEDNRALILGRKIEMLVGKDFTSISF